ncbi:MAG TPA: HlyD family secretion protein [Candidatus Tyrphobacter sp.]
MSTETQEKQQAPGPDGAVAPAIVRRAAEELRSKPRRRLFVILGAVLVLALVLILGVPWLQYMLSHQGTDDAYVDANIVQITSKIPERIRQILVDTNAPVRQGQLLIVLDDRDELARVQQAQAQYDLALANQRTTVEQGLGGVTQAQGGIAQAGAQVGVAISNLPGAEQAYAKAAADLARTQSLVSTGDEPVEQLDAARAAAAAAASQLHAAQNQVASAQAAQEAAQGGATEAQGKLAQASDPSQVAEAQAQLELAQRNVVYTRIHSPIDGYVGERDAEIGQTISAGMKLLTVIPVRGIFITANYKETQMGNIRVGETVDIKVDAYRGVTFHGHVTSINPASENTYALVPSQNASGNFVKVTQRVPVRISIDDARSDMPLRPGMSVETYIAVH